ncbi:MAG: TetR family transcriptional regulator, partial [Kofleriaceae bacterium]
MTVHSAASSDKRERILDAAERIFARHGFFAAKVSDVAKEAGVADGTIYLYFKNKDDLLISLFERRMQQLNGGLKAAIAGKPPREALRAFIKAYVQILNAEPTGWKLINFQDAGWEEVEVLDAPQGLRLRPMPPVRMIQEVA